MAVVTVGGATGRANGWAWCGGPHLSFFQAEFFAHGELFPLRRRAFYDLRLPVPAEPWALLNRTYGADCAVESTARAPSSATRAKSCIYLHSPPVPQ